MNIVHQNLDGFFMLATNYRIDLFLKFSKVFFKLRLGQLKVKFNDLVWSEDGKSRITSNFKNETWVEFSLYFQKTIVVV